MVRALLLLLVIPALCFLGNWYNNLNDNFSVRRISSRHCHRADSSVPSIEHEDTLRIVLAQPFSYLGKGAQSFVFASQDGEWVIKFFKQHHLHVDPVVMKLRLPSVLNRVRQRSVDRRHQRRDQLFDSCKVAYHHLAEETGLIYAQLSPGADLGLHVTIVDKRGRKSRLALDGMEYMVQRRAELVRDRIEEGSVDEGRSVLDQVLALIDSRTRKGFIDADPAFLQNYGLTRDRVIQFDVGTIRYKEEVLQSDGYSDEVVKATQQLREWVKENHPELADHLDNGMWDLIRRRAGELERKDDLAA